MAGESEDADAFQTYRKKIKLPLELSKFKNIYVMISAGDYINHAVFLVDELTVGIKNLLDRELIEIQNDYLKPTRKTSDFYEKEKGSRKWISIKTALGILEKLLEIDSDPEYS